MKTRLTIELDQEIKKKIKVSAAQEGKSMREFIVSILLAWIDHISAEKHSQ